jgi:hypothetical protein
MKGGQRKLAGKGTVEQQPEERGEGSQQREIQAEQPQCKGLEVGVCHTVLVGE